MAVLQGLLALIFRSLGKIVNTAFGWATVMLFGKVPEKRQTILSAVAFLAVLWLFLLIGVVFPRFAAFALAFVPLPQSVDTKWLRIAMLVGAAVLPAIVGILSLYMLDPDQRPKTVGAKLKVGMRGYPYTFGLSLTMLVMTLLAPLMKVRDLARRWTSAHVPIVVESDDYDEVLSDLEQLLKGAGYRPTRQRASWVLRFPTKILATFAGSMVDRFVAEKLTVLKGPNFEVLLHPSDLVIRGKQETVSRLHAAITENLTFTQAYLTWSREGQGLEDELRRVWERLQNGGGTRGAEEELKKLERELHEKEFQYEEWEVLFREKLVVERDLLRKLGGNGHKQGSTLSREKARPPSRKPLWKVAAVPASALTAGIALGAVTAQQYLAHRRRRPLAAWLRQ